MDTHHRAVITASKLDRPYTISSMVLKRSWIGWHMLLLLAAIYSVQIVLHGTLLTLPYFWDEAGYYIPAAFDFFQHGTLVPVSTLSNAHPPLPAIYLSLWWRVIGFSPLVTRSAMLLVSSFALLEVFQLASIYFQKNASSLLAPTAVSVLTALYPIFYVQSSLAHADLPAMALSLSGLRLWLQDKKTLAATALSLACLAKETAIVFILALFAAEFLYTKTSRSFPLGTSLIIRFQHLLPLCLTIIPLVIWYFFHYSITGYVFGNADYFHYNLTDTLVPSRFLAALFLRAWHLFGHMNLWVLTLAAVIACVLWHKPHSQQSDPKVRFILIFIILVQWLFFSLAGGALLTRYVLTAFPLVIILLVDVLARRTTFWVPSVAIAGLAFVIGWWHNPAYRAAPEDNLAYRDFIQLQQSAVGYLATHRPTARVLTAWPATDELSRPWLGYVDHPFTVSSLEDFSMNSILAARSYSGYDTILAFNTKDQSIPLFRFKWWNRVNKQYFHDQQDLPPELIVQTLAGKIDYMKTSSHGWIAIITVDRSRLAINRLSRQKCQLLFQCFGLYK